LRLAHSLDHLVGEREQSIRHVEPEIADPRVLKKQEPAARR
jgi:hypothetical protein